jgi:type IV pilus assembly protein PilE
MRKISKALGFTLIELMIVVAVIGVLAAVAYPSYKDSVRKSRRVDAQSALTDAAQRLEAFYARNAQYTVDMTDLGYDNANWNLVPQDVPNADQYYRIRLLNIGGCNVENCYRLEARPRNDQANDRVDRYRLWSTGRKQRRESGAWINNW